jgi:hypothetical protein
MVRSTQILYPFVKINPKSVLLVNCTCRSETQSQPLKTSSARPPAEPHDSSSDEDFQRRARPRQRKRRNDANDIDAIARPSGASKPPAASSATRSGDVIEAAMQLVASKRPPRRAPVQVRSLADLCIAAISSNVASCGDLGPFAAVIAQPCFDNLCRTRTLSPDALARFAGGTLRAVRLSDCAGEEIRAAL